MNSTDPKVQIAQALAKFIQHNLSEAAIQFFETLGYNTQRRAGFAAKTAQFFMGAYGAAAPNFDAEKALTSDWKYVDLLFQLTRYEITSQLGIFDTSRVDNTIIESYLFFAIELTQAEYSRTALSRITREINKVFPMPVMILFKHSDTLSLAVIDRRLHKLSSWLILPAINKRLKAALKNYQIKLTEVLPGFWQAKTLFPLYVVAYNQLPFEMPYHTFKLFIKSGKPVQEVFRAVLQSEHRKTWVSAVETAMDLIHPKDFKEVLKEMSLATERQELRETIKELLKDDIEKELTEREQKGELKGELKALKKTAKQMMADGMPIKNISKYTGLSEEEITKL